MSELYRCDSNSLIDRQASFLKMNSVSNYAKLIEVRIEFMSLGEVDTMNEKYQAEVKVRSRWYDDEIIEVYDKTKNWNPKLFIENALHDLKEEISYHVTRLEDKTIVTETRVSKGSFWERIELQNFPVDIQELSVTIASKLRPNQVKLVQDSQKISNIHPEALNTFRDQQKWKLYKMVSVSESASYDIGSATSLAKNSFSESDFHQIKINKNQKTRSKLVASIFCSRRPGYYIINCYSFILLITVLSLTLFAIETKLAQNRISGTFTLILTRNMNGFYVYESSTLLHNPQTVIKMGNASNYAKLIEVRIEFLSFGEVDTMNEKFQAEVKIRSRWYDDEDIDVYDKTRHWYPKLFIANALHDVKEEISFHVDKLNEKSIITETRIAKGSFWERIELQNFPIDIQELSITLASKYKPNRVKLVADSTKISRIQSEALHTFRDQQKWKLYRIVKVSQSASYDQSPEMETKDNNGTNDSEFHEIKVNEVATRPKIVATCYCSRRPGYFLINCYSFIFLITVLSLTLFAFETSRTQNRIAGTFTLILTSVSFKWVTNRFIPAISYMTSLDRYQIISIIFLCLCCVWHSSISSIEIDDTTKLIVDKVALVLFAILFTSMQVFFAIGIIKAIQQVKALKRSEINFVKQYGMEDSDADDDDYEDDYY